MTNINTLPGGLPFTPHGVEFVKAGVINNTGMALEGLRTGMNVPVVSNAMQGAMNLGINALGILAPMALIYTGIMTTLGMPPPFLKKALGRS